MMSPLYKIRDNTKCFKRETRDKLEICNGRAKTMEMLWEPSRNIHEYQAQKVFEGFGVAVPLNFPAFSVKEAS